ncbi:apolipoprotein D and lipocalin family protein [Chaetoceros tenuissimus]|uniref:Apolipoprotein D and lipocalin family protein n=1 Tax=Chaetoceros tenuissimus TaxID=426638 RepID=A0AAD3CQ52_9STRA|nr:apolipoprotein D and lipocalin family protein [Chaetoceros tenuissimus]
MGASSSKSLPSLNVVPECITEKFMGPWFVIAVKPTIFETTNSNAVEIYSRSPKDYDIKVDFQYNKNEPITSPLKRMTQKGWILGDKENSGSWQVSPGLGIKMPYPIIELDSENYQHVVVGNPGRSYFWIMSRTPTMNSDLLEDLKKKLVEKHQYDLDGMRMVPQKWTKAERTKRNLDACIPDELLADSNEKN